ncbi:MAG: MFS transporter [Halofilum sp. (in: g-proteobacteria)]|nr:MFS transporter [Halofilum sp. (in: g-proteobacteria)]
MSYLGFLATNARFLAFGFVVTFASGFGQTFFVGIFGAPLREAFGLTHGGFGTVYSLATLLSACLLLWLGRLIDRVDLRTYTVLATIVFTGACLWLAWAPALPVLLFVGLTLLRLGGQGLFSHIGVTSMGRYYFESRGRALSIANMGFPAGSFLLPIVGVALIESAGWRLTWLLIAGAIVLLVLPVALWLLRDHGERHRLWAAGMEQARVAADPHERDWLLHEVLRDPRFYLLLPVVLTPPFVFTGFFIHQAQLVEEKGWTMEWFALGFMLHSFMAMGATLILGSLVDHWGARRLLPFYLLPLIAGLVVLATADGDWAAMAFMLTSGLSGGAALTVVGALWAELYGTTHLGAIRSLVWALVVFTTAAGSMMVGALLDTGFTMATLAGAVAGFALLASLLAAWSDRASGRGTVRGIPD